MDSATISFFIFAFFTWAAFVSVTLVLFRQRLRHHAELLEDISKAQLVLAELVAETRRRVEALEHAEDES